MMNSQASTIETSNFHLSGEDIFASLHRRGQLLPLFRGVALEAIIERAAREAGLAVSDEELQKASEPLRRQLGLQSAAMTRKWLQEERLSLEQFERRIELDVLTEKFKDFLLARYGEQHFHSDPHAWCSVRLRCLTVATLNEAREICLQIQDDGVDFGELVQTYSLDPHGRQTRGDRGITLKKHLSPGVRDAVFSTTPGAITSPLHGPDGFDIFFIEEFPEPTFDAVTQAEIREELFRRFVSLKLRDVRIISPHLIPSFTESVSANAESGSAVSTSTV